MSLFTHDHELLEDFFLNHKNVFTDGIFKRPPLQHVDNVFQCLTNKRDQTSPGRHYYFHLFTKHHIAFRTRLMNQ